MPKNEPNFYYYNSQVVPYKECKSGQEPQQFTETKLTAKKFIEQGCTQGKKTIPHTKLLPECRNVTKQNCVTLWETDEAVAQQWAGTDRWALCLQML